MIIRVIKFGGSLLNTGDVMPEFMSWLERQTPANHVFIAGGGAVVDCIRDWQKIHGLDDERCHRLSIQAMSLTARLLHCLIPNSVMTENIENLNQATDRITVLDPLKWLIADDTLPRSWSVTSDSIAAELARQLVADELVLLKSRLPAKLATDLAELAEDGLIDPYFPTAAASLPRVRLVNLRGTCEEIDMVNARKAATL
jgi:aspartokinase-like uncharacterized kinase